jgi:hypothetical protein
MDTMTWALRLVTLLPALWVLVGGGWEPVAADSDLATHVSVDSAGQPASVCVVQLTASGEVLGVLVNHPTNFTLAVAIPSAQHTNVPVLCQDLEEIALAVANQEASEVSVSVEVFTHQGASLCTRGPFTLPEQGHEGWSSGAIVERQTSSMVVLKQAR